MHAHLFERAVELIQRHDRLAYIWAQRQLGKGTFPLTGHAHSAAAPRDALWCPTTTCREGGTPEARAPTLFQTALEWIASGKDDTLLHRDSFLSENLLPRARVISTTIQGSLRIDRFANRPGLVDRDNYLQFLAEHIRILGQAGAAERPLVDPSIESHFLPVRSLGQWRASFDFKAISTRADRVKASSPKTADAERLPTDFLVPATERLLTYAVVSAFRQAIDARNYKRGPLIGELKSLLPFTVFWWSKEILFVQKGNTCARLCRSRTGDFWLDESPADEPSHRPANRFLSYFDLDERWVGSWIIMNLREVGLPSPKFYASWGFDEVHFRVPMFDPTNIPDDWARIESTVQTAMRRMLRNRFYSIDAAETQENFNRVTYISHGIGNALNAAHNRLHSLRLSLVELVNSSVGPKVEEIRDKAAVVSRQLAEAQGLAYFARSGLKELEDGPPRKWRMEPDEPAWTRKEALVAMRSVVAYFLGAYELRGNNERITVVFLIGSERKDYSLRELADMAKESTPLTLPPFSRRKLHDIRGGAPIFLVTLGLAEILRNAQNHLVNSWQEYSEVIPESSPRLLVDLEVDERGDVTVLVCGLAKRGHNLHSLSLERIIRAEKSLPPHRRLVASEQAHTIPAEQASLLHHPESGFERTLTRWRLFCSKAIEAFREFE